MEEVFFMKRMLSLLLCLMMALAIPGTSLGETDIQDQYDEAMELAVKGEYAAAMEKFTALGIYSDSTRMVDYCQGCLLAEAGDWEQAMFYMGRAGVKDSSKLQDYYYARFYETMADAIDRDSASQYQLDTAAYFYRRAFSLFDSLDDFKDSQERAEKCGTIYNQYAFSNQQVIPNKQAQYNEALAKFREGKWLEAREIFFTIQNYRDAQSYFLKTFYQNGMDLLEAGDPAGAFCELSNALGYYDTNEIATNLRDQLMGMIQVSDLCTAALKADGTVLYAGSSLYGLSQAAEWTDIAKLRAVGSVLVGLKKDGTVVALGDNSYGQCNVQDWTDIIDIAVNDSHVIGLKKDGTVVAAGSNTDGQCDVQDWTEIISIATNDFHTIGIKSDGSLIAAGRDDDKQCQVDHLVNLDKYYVTRAIGLYLGRFHSIVLYDNHDSVSVGSDLYGQRSSSISDCSEILTLDYNTFILTTDNRLHAWGLNDYHQCDTNVWKNVMQFSASDSHTAAVLLDGRAVALGDNLYGQCDVEEWEDILCVWAADGATIGLKKDGSLVVTGNNKNGILDIEDWKLW